MEQINHYGMNAVEMELHYSLGQLGTLEAVIPPHQRMSVSLTKLFENAVCASTSGKMRSPGYPHLEVSCEIPIQEIWGIFVYGGVLYRNFPEKEKTPEDFDIMVITENELHENKTIKPERKDIDNYWSTSKLITCVETQKIEVDDFGVLRPKHSTDGAALHIKYKTGKQFFDDLEKDRENPGYQTSESILRYGICLVEGHTDFLRDLHTKVKGRENKHFLEWFSIYNGDGREQVNARIL